jgi:hypothetical protein
MHIFAPQNKDQAYLHPPIFIAMDTPLFHGDVSAVLGARISVLNLDLIWSQSITMGEVLYSTKWVKYNTLPQATTQNTTLITQQST